jgi:outer membrane protein assembly factor BamD
MVLAFTTLALTASLTGCKSRSGREGKMTDPQEVYQRARKALNGGDYALAVKVYEALMARYPFAAETRQSRLDVIYAYYRAGESESAIDAADTFIRENPTHPRIDYAWYLKGLTDFERFPNFLERWFHVDMNQRPPTEARRSFTSFQTVVEQYPNSEYAHDARRRMIFPSWTPNMNRSGSRATCSCTSSTKGKYGRQPPRWRSRNASDQLTNPEPEHRILTAGISGVGWGMT